MKILVAVPTRGSIYYPTIVRLQEIRDLHPGLDPIYFKEGHLNVALTRNFITRYFMEGDWDALIMVDDDVVPPGHLIEIAEYLSDWDMIGIPYLMMILQFLEYTVFDRDENGETYHYKNLEEGVHECDAVGTGCVLIHRRVFEKLGDRPFRMGNDPDSYITDDFLFCEDMKEAGFKIAYCWQTWFADHCTTVNLSPLKDTIAKLSQGLVPDQDSLENAMKGLRSQR